MRHLSILCLSLLLAACAGQGIEGAKQNRSGSVVQTQPGEGIVILGSHISEEHLLGFTLRWAPVNAESNILEQGVVGTGQKTGGGGFLTPSKALPKSYHVVTLPVGRYVLKALKALPVTKTGDLLTASQKDTFTDLSQHTMHFNVVDGEAVYLGDYHFRPVKYRGDRGGEPVEVLQDDLTGAMAELFARGYHGKVTHQEPVFKPFGCVKRGKFCNAPEY